MADDMLGAYNIADLGPQYLHTVDPWFSPLVEERTRQKTDYPRAVGEA